jgi:hypothetical protein
VIAAVGSVIVTVPETVLEESGEFAVTEEMPGAGYKELIYVAICEVVSLTEDPA